MQCDSFISSMIYNQYFPIGFQGNEGMTAKNLRTGFVSGGGGTEIFYEDLGKGEEGTDVYLLLLAALAAAITKKFATKYK